ncbi:DUF1926 domain-containing protein [candidate division KSB1 bacterium]|nr:DUF1926 domain-containing protein [candidate division KSB1 bacterium]
MKKINLVLGIHNHQPVGNFDFVFEEAFQKAYLPFLKVHKVHPDIRLAQHFSGILLEWLEKNHPEFIKLLKQSVSKKQVEMLTGGYYEPILPSIPEQDIVGQIVKLTNYVIEKTGYKPSGLWLTERVWEPYLPRPIVRAGVKYTVIDDSHFKSSGLQDQNLLGYYVTEHEGFALNIFPISEKLRYLIPFQPPEKTIKYLRSLATDEGDRLIVFADDGEKFGVWPGTFEQCFENNWLNDFFTLIEQNLDWINLISFDDALSQLKPLGTVYLPTASYREMMEWALPVNAIKEYEGFYHWLKEKNIADYQFNFIKGGFWRNFLAKYPEANNLQKRMLKSSNRFQKLNSKNTELVKARDFIYAGQCNCPYWHGVFGGLYLPHLRNAIYSNLIQADAAMDKVEFKGKEKTGWVKSEIYDYNADGFGEVIVETDRMGLFFSPNKGGSLTELDFKPKAINLIDTMTRRQEAYHQKLYEMNLNQHNSGKGEKVASIHDLVLTKEEGLEKYLNYDWYNRTSLIDHFLHPDVDLKQFAQAQYREQGDFVNQPYNVKIVNKDESAEINLERNGHVWIGSEFVPLYVGKKILVGPGADSFTAKYTLKNTNNSAIELWFGVEFATSLLAGNAADRNYIIPGVELEKTNLASIGSVKNVKKIFLRDDWLGIQVGFEVNRTAAIWRFPIETISMSEAGFERVYQCSVIMPHWKIVLEPGNSWTVVIKESIEQL